MATLQTRIKLERKLINDASKGGNFAAHKGGQVLGFGTTIGNALHDVALGKEVKIDGLSIDTASDKLATQTWEAGAPKTFILWHGVAITDAEHTEIVAVVDKNKNRTDAELEAEFNLPSGAIENENKI